MPSRSVVQWRLVSRKFRHQGSLPGILSGVGNFRSDCGIGNFSRGRALLVSALVSTKTGF